MKKGYAVDELAQFFVDAANKLGELYCRVCRKVVSALTHGGYEILQHFQGYHHFVRYQWLHIETPGCRVLDFEGNPLPEGELGRQRENVMLAPFVVRDREYPFQKSASADTNAGKSFLLDRCTPSGWKLRVRTKTVGTIRAESQ